VCTLAALSISRSIFVRPAEHFSHGIGEHLGPDSGNAARSNGGTIRFTCQRGGKQKLQEESPWMTLRPGVQHTSFLRDEGRSRLNFVDFVRTRFTYCLGRGQKSLFCQGGGEFRRDYGMIARPNPFSRGGGHGADPLSNNSAAWGERYSSGSEKEFDQVDGLSGRWAFSIRSRLTGNHLMCSQSVPRFCRVLAPLWFFSIAVCILGLSMSRV